MSSVVIAGNTSGSVTLAAPDVAGTTTLNLPTVSGGTLVTSDASGNVGIGTASPSQKLHVNGNTLATNYYVGNGNSTLSTTGGENGIIVYGSSGTGNANAVGIYTGSAQRYLFDTNGTVIIAQAAGKYTIDTSNGATSVANGGTVDFANASGMLLVNNHASGNITIWLCGAGVTSSVSTIGTVVGSFAYIAGIGGYRWTNNYGSTATFGFFFIRTRQTA